MGMVHISFDNFYNHNNNLWLGWEIIIIDNFIVLLRNLPKYLSQKNL